MRSSLITSFVLALFLITATSYANQVTYRVSVTIPEIVGVNVPAETDAENPEPLFAQSFYSGMWDMTTEKAMRGERQVVVQSFTVL